MSWITVKLAQLKKRFIRRRNVCHEETESEHETKTTLINQTSVKVKLELNLDSLF